MAKGGHQDDDTSPKRRYPLSLGEYTRIVAHGFRPVGGVSHHMPDLGPIYQHVEARSTFHTHDCMELLRWRCTSSDER